jgi:hypothetical protein
MTRAPFVTHIYPIFAEEINREARDKHKPINGRKRKRKKENTWADINAAD